MTTPLPANQDPAVRPLPGIIEAGHLIVCGGDIATVLEVTDHAPGTHPDSPIIDRIWARQYRTDRGSRWSGIKVTREPYCEPFRWQG